MIYILDTNILLRFFLGDHQKQSAECQKLFALIEQKKIVAHLPGIVLSEFTWTTQSFYGLPKTEVVQMQEAILQLFDQRLLDKYDYNHAVNSYSKKSVKFIDCVLASALKVESNKWAIISYDHDFDKLGIIRKEPGELIKS